MSLAQLAVGHGSLSDRSLLPSDMKSRPYQTAVAEARRLLGRQVISSNVVEHLLHDNRFHVLFPSHDGRSIGEDCRNCAEQIVGDAKALRALAAEPLASSSTQLTGEHFGSARLWSMPDPPV